MKNPASLIAVTLCLLISCTSKNSDNKEKLERQSTIGKYLYLTKDSVLHSNGLCTNIKLLGSPRGMKFIDTAFITSDVNITYCTKCFDDKTYERVQRMIEWNCLGDTIY